MASNGGNVHETLDVCLQLFQAECNSQSDLKAALELAIKICRNILSNPTEGKYKQIKKNSKALSSKIWQYSGGQQLMFAAGWTEVDESIMYLQETDLSSVVKYLEDKLKEYGLCSNTSEASEASCGWTQEELKEKERLVQEQREKTLASIKRKKEEEKRVKAQIEADRDNINARQLKASKAVERNFGSNVKRFADIGVDVNKGG